MNPRDALLWLLISLIRPFLGIDLTLRANHLRPVGNRDFNLARRGTAVLPALSSLRGDASVSWVIAWAYTHTVKESFKAYVNRG